MKDIDTPTSGLTIRRASLTDASMLGQVYVGCFPFLFSFAYGAGPEVSGRILGDLYAAKVIPISNIHLALDDETLSGFAVLRLGDAMPRPGAGEFWHILRRHLGIISAARAFIGSFIVSLVFSGRSPDPRMAYLDTLGVAEEKRGLGIGSLLLEHCFSLARQKTCIEIALHVMKSNVDAKRLYEKMGFEARPDERLLPRIVAGFVPWRRAYLMVKTLS